MQRPTHAGSVSAEGSGLSAEPFQELGLQPRRSGLQAQGGRTWGDDCLGWGDAGPLAHAAGTALGPVTVASPSPTAASVAVQPPRRFPTLGASSVFGLPVCETPDYLGKQVPRKGGCRSQVEITYLT